MTEEKQKKNGGFRPMITLKLCLSAALKEVSSKVLELE
jgi:hypothetical protein